MLFSSIPFIYCFLPIFFLIYCAVPIKAKNLVLLLFSLVFYAWGEPKYVILMVVSIFSGYVLGILIEKFRGSFVGKALTALSVAISLGFLFYFKYVDFFIISFNRVFNTTLPVFKIALPIGISFYTFQLLSYTIDVFRGKVNAQKSFIKLGAYISMFPQLVAGPIVRYGDVKDKLDNRTLTLTNTSTGIRRFITGLFKKVIIANTLGQFCDIYNSSDSPSIIFAWLFVLCLSLEIYYDFSGYSDMAIGIGRILGFDFPENFNYPFTSKSVTEFWRRWHITLGRWFKDYLYIPLGGNRVTKPRWIFNILIVWMATGLWHGASWNFVVWGIYFAVLLVFEKFILLKKLENSKILSHIYTVFVVIISFVIFNSTSLSVALNQLNNMFGLNGIPVINRETMFFTESYAVIIVVAIIGSTPVIKNIYKKLTENKSLSKLLVIIEPLALVTLLIIITAGLVNGSFNPFLYFRF